MHAYRRFVREQLDAHGWTSAQLSRASGLSKQHISKILNDDRKYLGHMPDDATLRRLAQGFQVPLETVRTAAARSLVGYTDENAPLILDLRVVSLDALLHEIKRRVSEAERVGEKIDDLGETLSRGIHEARRDEGLKENGELL